jgi:hypothetical protein
MEKLYPKKIGEAIGNNANSKFISQLKFGKNQKLILPGRDPTATHIGSWRKYTQEVTKIKGTDSVVVQQFLRKTKRLHQVQSLLNIKHF